MKGIEFFCNTRNVSSDLRRVKRRSKDLSAEKILHDLRQEIPLQPRYHNHQLRELKGAYELHTLTRLALVHRREANALVLMRTCSHSDLW